VTASAYTATALSALGIGLVVWGAWPRGCALREEAQAASALGNVTVVIALLAWIIALPLW
jgi:hypothetical protein